MTKAYTYGSHAIGAFATRHEAVGEAAIIGRKYVWDDHMPVSGPFHATTKVIAWKTEGPAAERHPDITASMTPNLAGSEPEWSE